MATLEQVEAATLDPEIVKAIVWCRLGGVRPTQDGAFGSAKALGLLAQDDVWRATERGEGVLVALGLLEGARAPGRESVICLWVRTNEHPSPQMIACWPAWFDEVAERARECRINAEAEFESLAGESTGINFWTTTEWIDRAEVSS